MGIITLSPNSLLHREINTKHNCEFMNPNNIIFHCPRFTLEREKVARELTVDITLGNLVSFMLLNVENWDIVQYFMEEIIKIKELNKRGF